MNIDERGRRNINMRKKKTAGAMLICAAFALVAAAPLAQSAETDGTIHTILKYENGPPSTCAVAWTFAAPSDGTWCGHIVNYGMRWIILDMIDEDTQEVIIDRDMYRYAAVGQDFYSEPVSVLEGHKYNITGTPNGPLGTWVTVEDIFVPDNMPPAPSFTVSVDGLEVSVDASSSEDPDGTIVDYAWDWGDGTTGTGETATHTYVPPETVVPPGESTLMGPVLGDIQNPYTIRGWTNDSNGDPLLGSTVTVINENNGGSMLALVAPDGRYMANLANMNWDGYYYANGDEIRVVAVNGDLTGEAVGYVDTADENSVTQIDVTLEGAAQPFEVTITLTVTDNGGATASVSQTVTLYP